MRCTDCGVRVGPCLDEHGNPMQQEHLSRAMATAGRIEHQKAAMEEARRLRAAEIRRVAAERNGR